MESKSEKTFTNLDKKDHYDLNKFLVIKKNGDYHTWRDDFAGESQQRKIQFINPDPIFDKATYY